MASWFVGNILQGYKRYGLCLASNCEEKVKTSEKILIYHGVIKLVLISLLLITN